MRFASRWYAYAVAIVTLITLVLNCIDNSMDKWDPDYPADNYQINPKWSAIDTNNLTILKVYKVPYKLGSEQFDRISAYTPDTGFLDTAFFNSQLKNDTMSLCFLSTGKSSLIIDGFRPNGKHIYDTVKITVTNPYKIDYNNDSFSITPKPAFEATGLNLAVEWKLNDTKTTFLDPSTPFQLPPTLSGAFKLAASLVDTVRNHRFTVGTVDDSVHIKNDNDTTGPAITLDTPAKDSIATNSSIYNVKLQCADTSGVLSVNGVMGGQTFTGMRESGKNWEITVNGLSPNVFNTIIFTATDSSLRANKTTLTLHIKYDPAMDDMEGPTIKHISCPADSAVVNNPIIVITDSIIDPSGLDSVYWTLNNVWAGKLMAVSGKPNTYQLRDTLTSYHINRIVIHAIDSSSHHNHDSDIVILDYNLPPAINDTAINTKRNTAKTWTLNAQTMDNDTLLWSRLSSPSSLSGSITGTLPSVTFIPAADWSGVDSFYVRVSDGYWSDTGKVKLSVVDAPVAPGIKTQPASATKNVGQPVTFSVEVNSDVNPAPSYQWKHNGTVIDKASASSYTIGSVSIADSGEYTVTIANSAGTITSSAAKLTVNYAPSIAKQPVSQILYLGKSVTFSVEAKGSPAPNYVWRKNGNIISGITGSSYTISSPDVNDSGKYTVTVSNSVDTVISDTAGFYSVIKCISAGQNHSLFLKTDGRLFACGGNDLGQIGDNTTTDRLSPVQIMTDIQMMSAGSGHSLALKSDGTIWGWGNSGSGQLGSDLGSVTTKPIQITSINSVKKLVACGGYSMFIKNDGTLWACGQNGDGRLGDGTTDGRSHPVQVLNVNNVQSVSGLMYNLIITKDNVLWGCGNNYWGDLGDSTTINRLSPVQVKGMNNVKDASAGGGHSLIIKMDGTLWSCGYNYYGQCCDGSNTDHIVPIQVPNINNVTAVSAGGGSFSMVLKSDGTLWACGSNGYGQLGNGSTSSPSSLVQIMSNVQSVSAGDLFTLILKTDGSLWACGQNTNGQLGDGTTTDRSTPVRITF